MDTGLVIILLLVKVYLFPERLTVIPSLLLNLRSAIVLLVSVSVREYFLVAGSYFSVCTCAELLLPDAKLGMVVCCDI